MKNALRTMPAGEPANANAEPEPIPDPVEHERVVKLIALGMFTGGLNVYQQLLLGGQPNPPVPIAQSPTEIMTADDVAEFLGVDRNTSTSTRAVARSRISVSASEYCFVAERYCRGEADPGEEG